MSKAPLPHQAAMPQANLFMLSGTALHWGTATLSSLCCRVSSEVEVTSRGVHLCAPRQSQLNWCLSNQPGIWYTFTLLRLLTLSWHCSKQIREGQLKYQRVVAASLVLREELPTVLCQSGKCVEWQGSVLHRSLLSIVFPELDDRDGKEALIFKVYGIAGMLVERARTICLNCLKKLCLKFRESMCKEMHLVRDNDVCVYGPRNGRLRSNPVEEHTGITVKCEVRRCQTGAEVYLFNCSHLFPFSCSSQDTEYYFLTCLPSILGVWPWVSAITRQSWAQISDKELWKGCGDSGVHPRLQLFSLLLV